MSTGCVSVCLWKRLQHLLTCTSPAGLKFTVTGGRLSCFQGSHEPVRFA